MFEPNLLNFFTFTAGSLRVGTGLQGAGCVLQARMDALYNGSCQRGCKGVTSDEFTRQARFGNW